MNTFHYLNVRFQKYGTKTASTLLLLIGNLVLVGWAMNISFLKSILPGLATMKFNTALCFVLTGVVLWLIADEQTDVSRQRLAQGCTVIVVLITALTLSEYAFGWDLGIDQFLFKDETPLTVNSIPGRMSYATAFNFIVLGVALWLVSKSVRYRLAQALALLVIAIAFLILVGYLYGVTSLYDVFFFTTVAFHTGLLFLIAGFGVLFARPHTALMAAITADAPGGVLARQLLPVLVLVPLVLGWLRLKGQELGLYSTEFGLALLVLSNIAITTFLLWWNAGLLNRSDVIRKRIDAERQEAVERFRLLVESINDYAIYMLDPSGNIISWNTGAEHIKGYQTHEILGKHFSLFYPKDIIENGELTSKLLEAASRGSIDDLGTRVRKDGTTFFGNGTITALRDNDGQVIGFAKITRDISERERVQASLRESEERFRIIFERSTLGKTLTSPDGRLLMVNQAFADLVGYNSDELFQMNFVTLTHPEDRAENVDIVRRLLTNEETKYRFEKRYIHKSGTIIWADINTTLLRDEAGVPLYFITSVADITERKQMEREIQNAERLRVELEKEKELLLLKEKFVSIVSHEFRTPLSVIMSSAELVNRYRERMSEERQSEHVEEVIKQAQYMTALLDDVLTFNKARSGKFEFNPTPFDLQQLCRDALERVELIEQIKHEFLFHTEGDLEAVNLDPKLIQHVVTNLMSNAVKYSPEGGQIRLEIVRSGQEVVLHISDQGIGIPEEAQKRLFEPFHRADNVGTISGTGLGLAIVKESVDVHNGTITCESSIDKGTTFIVRLPIIST